MQTEFASVMRRLMWTFIELGRTADYDARLSVLWSLAIPGMSISLARLRKAAPSAAFTDHRAPRQGDAERRLVMANRIWRIDRRTTAALGVALVLILGEIGAPRSVRPKDTAYAQREAPVVMVATDGAFALLDGQERPLGDLLAGTDYLFILENQGSEAYGAQFVRLGDGVTADDLVTAARQSGGALWRLATPVGGFGRIAPGGQVLMVDAFAEPGVYAVLSPTRVAEGMVATFRVGGRTAPFDPVQRFDLSADTLVLTAEFSIAPPAARPRGVRNDGQQPHEAQVVRLAAGVTVADLVAAGDDPVPAGLAEAVGGTAALAPGMVAPWPISRLEPGRYALVCLLVDAASGRRHLALGMAADLTVTGP